MGRTSIGLRNVAVTSTPPQVMVMTVVVEVNFGGFSVSRQARPNESRDTNSHVFLDRAWTTGITSHPLEEIVVHPDHPCPRNDLARVRPTSQRREPARGVWSNTYRFITKRRPCRIQRAPRRSLSHPCLKVRCLDSERYRRRNKRVSLPALREGDGSHKEKLKERQWVRQHPDEAEEEVGWGGFLPQQ